MIMSRWSLISVVLMVIFFIGSTFEFDSQANHRQGNAFSPVSKARPGQTQVTINNDFGKMPLSFIPNKGQMDKQVYFYIQGKDKSIYFTPGGITYTLNTPGTQGLFLKKPPLDPTKTFINEEKSVENSHRWVVKLDFVGARKDAKPESLEQSGTVISFFKGKPKDWQTGIQAASKIIYKKLWPGIDLVYYGTVNKLKYEFIVHPGADPSKIKLAYRGAESVKENNHGQLEVQTPNGTFFDDTPEAWQEIAGKREHVPLKYAVETEKGNKKRNNSTATYGFSVGKYNKSETLILDPAVIVYCGYIGGSGFEEGLGIAVDGFGCVYATGVTRSPETTLPVAVGPDLTYNDVSNYDAFVVKINADGTSLDYCGYIGGNSEEYGYGIAVDSSGCAYVAGVTVSNQTTFPVLGGPDLTFNGGSYDAFVAKIKSDGTGLDYCGYIGGSQTDNGMGIAVDASGSAYVTGYTYSDQTTFPVTGGPNLLKSVFTDAFVAKIKSDGTALDYCGYIGGSSSDHSFGIAVDTLGCAYITGFTSSTETSFPVKVGPDLTFNGSSDAFVAKVKADGTGLDFCGYIGGSGGDRCLGIDVDPSGCAYVTGWTDSNETTFPVTVGPDLTFNGSINDAFVAKIKADGTTLDYCGYIGGSSYDEGHAIAVDATGCAYVLGLTGSTETTFPVTGGPSLTYNGGGRDLFVAKTRPNGSVLVYCGYIGGSGDDWGFGVAVDNSGCAYVTGFTDSTESSFPVTVGPDMTYNGGPGDVFVAKISSTNITYSVNFAAGNGGTVNGITTQTVIHGGNCSAVEAIPNTGYEFVNWTGTNGFVTTTDNPLTVTNVTADMDITAHFLLSNPAGWTPVENLQYNMVVYGKAYNGNNPAAEGDWIAAFGPGGASDCRGAAVIQTNGNFYITIGSNETSGEAISFKLWPQPSGPSLNGSEAVDFMDNEVYNGLSLHFGSRTQNISLVNGWNWISFNVLPADSSFNSVFTGLTGKIEQVKSQSQAAIYSGGSWIGDLTNMSGIANGIMYKVKTNQTCVVTATGSTIPFDYPLSLVTGWNWTAYLPTLKQAIGTAIDSIITPVNQVKSQYQSVIKINSSLVGDLTQMEPNKGYTIKMSQAGVLEYPYAAASYPLQAGKTSHAAKTPDKLSAAWPIIKGNQYNMVALGKVYFEGKPLAAPGYYLVSVGPNGEKDNRSFSPISTDASYFSTILGNAGGETIKFKLYHSVSGKTYDVAGSLSFQPDDLKTAFNLKTRSIKLTSPAGGAVLRSGDTCTISWDAYEVNNVKIELYKSGKSFTVIAPSVSAGSKTYLWTIPERMPFGNDYKMKVIAIDPGVTASDSSQLFSIKPAPALQVISPNGGEVWHLKQSYTITWSSIGIDNVKIELYKGMELKTVIAASTPAGTGKTTWTIPANHPQGTQFKIKITAVAPGVTVSDTGDNWFSIRY